MLVADTMTDTLALIGLEWIGTRLSAWGFDEDGEVVSSAVMHEPRRPAEAEYLARTHFHLGEWLGVSPEVPVIACGDIGLLARAKTRDSLALPLAVADIAATLFETGGVHIVPWAWQGAPPDLTGGAETLLAGLDEDHASVCIAGRHTKHIVLQHGRIMQLATEMTAEVRDLLLSRGALALTPDTAQAFDARVFQDWVEQALDTGKPLPVYAVEAALLSGRLDPAHKAAAIAGLMIGRDVATHYDPGDEVLLVSDGALMEAYGLAFDSLGAEVEEVSALGALQDGLVELADLAGLLSAD